MGYTTDFEGRFSIEPPLKEEDSEFLKKLASTRRMKRTGLDPKYGVDGEFFVDGPGFMGQDNDTSIVDSNSPPSTQPGLWLQWIPSEDGKHIEWDGGEKFYCYTEWVEYLIEKILKPRGYTLNGTVHWNGEERSDTGRITITDNLVQEIDHAAFEMMHEDLMKIASASDSELPRLVHNLDTNEAKAILLNRIEHAKGG